MRHFSFAILVLLSSIANAANDASPRCRTQPGDASFPTPHQFSLLNSSIEGRLVKVVPSAQFCKDRPDGCTNTQWTDPGFRSDIPGAMLEINWEQDYTSHPPSLCFRNSTVCGQGSVPLYAVNATSVAHIQAGVRFAQTHSLKVAVKASGHDFLGRSTAKNSLLLWTRYMEDNITFHESFSVGGEDRGSAVTIGSGVALAPLYQAAKAQGKVFVGASDPTVHAAGGYVQGAGHSALSPLYGLAADNALEFQVVIANGSLVTANEVSNPDLFWALRGGGAGSWGVIISATLRTFPTFDMAVHLMFIDSNSSASVAQLATLHAQHIFDWDSLHVGQYFYVTGSGSAFSWSISSYFPNASLAASNASLAPFIEDLTANGFIPTIFTGVADANDAIIPPANASGNAGGNGNTGNGTTGGDGGGGGGDLSPTIIGSRLIPTDMYRYNATAIGEVYQKLFDAGIPAILGHLVAGGKVSKNANVNSAVNPKWRTAKTHVVVGTLWTDETSPDDVETIREDFTKKKMPILDSLAGQGSGSYSNEADVREPDFQTTFFGHNYARLSSIKEAYDPDALFIVGAGVGSEKWDTEGLCRVGR